MNHLLIGTGDKTERLLELAGDHFLLIDDGPIADAFLAQTHAKLFDIASHSFNPLHHADYKRVRDIVQALYTASPEGKDTLTVRNGKRALAQLLLTAQRFDKLQTNAGGAGDLEAKATVDDMLFSPVLRRVLCNPTNFSFKGKVVAKLDRAEIGDFDAFLLAALLIGQCNGQLIVPDFGFYGRDFYTFLIRQNRLVCGVNFLSEASPALQQILLGIKGKTVYRTTREDAERLTFYINPAGNPAVLTELADGEYKTT